MRRRLLLVLTAVAALPGQTTAADVAEEILLLERQGMDGWQKGNPDPFLAITDESVTYIHPATPKRLQGLPAVRALYEQYRGTPLFESYEIKDPKVQVSENIAILTYYFVRRLGSATTEWNATEVYQRKQGGWRIIHSHWSGERGARD